MKLFSIFAICLLCGTLAGVTPVQKVIQLLNDLSAKAKAMKNSEAVEFAKFSQFCQDTQSNKKAEVERGDQLIESLTAETQKLDSDVSELKDAIGKLQQEIATNENKIKAAVEQRATDKKNHHAQIQDFGESVDALERAIATLEAQSHDRAQDKEFSVHAASLLELNQFVAHELPERTRRQVLALLALKDRDEQDPYLLRQGPQAHGYEFQSTSILDLLKKLHTEFKQKHTDTSKEEMNSAHAHDMLSQDLHDSIENANSVINDKSATAEEKAKLSAKKKKRLSAAINDRDEAASYLASLTTECNEKTKSFDEKQSLREDELAAISKAIEILSSEAVAGAAEKYLPGAPSLFQTGAVTLAQMMRTGSEPSSRTRKALASFLSSEAARLHSRRIGELVDIVAISKGPFTKVKKLIKDLIHKLLNEENQETKQKGWCDKEVGTNTLTRTKLQSSVDSLTAKADELDASILEMSQRLQELNKEVSELQTAVTQAQSVRDAEKAENEKTIADAKQAQEAVAAATAILKDFYAGASQATAFTQIMTGSGEPVKIGSPEWDSLANPGFKGKIDPGHQEGMQVFGEGPYTGEQGEAGGVLAMMEVIASDFSRLEMTTSTAEAEAAQAHKAFMTESKKSVAVKSKEIEMTTSDKSSAESDLVKTKADLSATQDQLLAAERYYDTLKPQCVDTGISYEERKKARDAEILSLEEAVKILSSTDFRTESGGY